MTVPFLIKYDDYIEADFKYIQQLAFYIEHGIDQDTYIPVHAIQRENKIKLGSAIGAEELVGTRLLYLNGIKKLENLKRFLFDGIV